MTKSNSKKRNVVIVAALCMVMAIGGIMAYFTAYETEDNVFTVGNVDITLTEPNWVAEDNQDITPNMEIPKDPTITNDGDNDAYVFIKVTVPKAKVTTSNVATGSKNASAVTQLYQLNGVAGTDAAKAWSAGATMGASDTIDSNWYLVKSDQTGSTDNVYVFAYGNATACTALAPEASTPAAFNSVTFANLCEENGEAPSGDTTLTDEQLTITVDAYAIQTTDITKDDAKTPAAVWSVLATQQNLTPNS